MCFFVGVYVCLCVAVSAIVVASAYVLAYAHPVSRELSMLSVVVTPWTITSGIDGVDTDVVSSFTSSRVIEFTSNRASHTFQAISLNNASLKNFAVAHVVNVVVSNVRSFVQEILLEVPVAIDVVAESLIL